MAFHKIVTDVSSEEQKWLVLDIEGEVPSDLEGHLIRIGPGKFTEGNSSLNHWFDGFSHLTGFKFLDKKVYFKNRFLESVSYKSSKKYKKNEGYMFYTNPSFSIRSCFRFMKNLLKNLLIVIPHTSTPFMDNCNVNFITNKHGDFIALTEVTQYLEFDKCLNTLGSYNYNMIYGVVTTAHPEIDGNHLYNIILDYNIVTRLKIIKQNLKTEEQKILKRFWRFCPSYFHSFSQTENYIIIIEQPYKVLFPILIILLPFSFASNLFWITKMKTKIMILDKKDGTLIFTEKTSPFFFFHTINAYEEGMSICLDIPCFQNPYIVKSLMIKKIKEGVLDLPAPIYTRFILDLQKNTILRKVYNLSVELPKINPAYKSKKHRFVYGIGTDNPEVNGDEANLFEKIVKCDVDMNSSKVYYKQHVFFGEPVFISKEHSLEEDDGYLCVLGIDINKDKSVLVCLDAKTMNELFIAYLPKIIPMTIHGHFIKTKKYK